MSTGSNDGGTDIADMIIMFMIGLLVAAVSFLAALAVLITVIVLARTKRYWYLATMLVAGSPLAWIITNARAASPDRWIGQTLRAPFEARTVWVNDTTPTIGEVWGQAPFLQGWLVGSILFGIVVGVLGRVLIDIGFFNPNMSFMQRTTPESLPQDLQPTGPTWTQYENHQF